VYQIAGQSHGYVRLYEPIDFRGCWGPQPPAGKQIAASDESTFRNGGEGGLALVDHVV